MFKSSWPRQRSHFQFPFLSFRAAKVCNQWQRNLDMNNEQWTEMNATRLYYGCTTMHKKNVLDSSDHSLPVFLGGSGGGGDDEFPQHRPSYYILLTHSLRLDICQNAIMRYNRRLEARFLFLWWSKLFAHDGWRVLVHSSGTGVFYENRSLSAVPYWKHSHSYNKMQCSFPMASKPLWECWMQS